MYVRLAAGWTDSAGTRYGAGEFVDIDVVTLAELEEQGVVHENERAPTRGTPADPGEVVAQWAVHGTLEEATLAWSLAQDDDDQPSGAVPTG